MRWQVLYSWNLRIPLRGFRSRRIRLRADLHTQDRPKVKPAGVRALRLVQNVNLRRVLPPHGKTVNSNKFNRTVHTLLRFARASERFT